MYAYLHPAKNLWSRHKRAMPENPKEKISGKAKKSKSKATRSAAASPGLD